MFAESLFFSAGMSQYTALLIQNGRLIFSHIALSAVESAAKAVTYDFIMATQASAGAFYKTNMKG